MNGSGRFDWDSALVTGIKAATILFVVALIAAFTTNAPLPTGEVALVPAYVAVQQAGVAAAHPVPRPLAPAAGQAAKR